MAAGLCPLYQLLHCDAGELQVVVHCFGGGDAYVSDKTTRAVTRGSDEDMCISELRSLRGHGRNVYIVYDVAKQGRGPHPVLPFTEWGMILVTPPNKTNSKGWKKQNGPTRIIMNCPDESDVRALRVWMKRNEQGGQGEYWKQVKERMDEVGPILRVILNAQKFNNRKNDIDEVINDVDSSNAKHYVGVMSDKLWNAVNASQLVQIVGVRRGLPTETYLNSAASRVIASKIYVRLSTKMHSMEVFKLLMHPDVFLLSNVLEISGTATFICRGAGNIIIGKLKELKPPGGRASQLAALEKNPEGHPTEAVGLPTKQGLPLEENFARCKVMYKPAYPTFPLVDAFFFMESPRETLVGLRMITADVHHTITSTVRQFIERMAEYFNDWEELSRDMSWEITYVQHVDE
ncbi:retrotransposon hot spot (RHS) protein [Trypanosoma cruzi Dm28c]|uniref:Retrotransposon hot spot (RHS) protein n=2 Tax=Trypanosoma cruzi TaxID=5693 RepID=V5AN41_TRYCR|nr:retrotransposon hot spot (RHS) protein [Trypanosoma cruzi Dm28c]PWU88805.1 putative retrotransposon hot spot (RHS) protein [Trypanosoma cruzi]